MPKDSNFFSEPDFVADVAVVGLGPGGLAAALQAAKKGVPVVAFTDRTNYIRGQRLKLSKTTISFLMENTDKSDPEDIKFWKKLKHDHSMQIKDIERFLYRKLVKKPNVQIVQLEKQGPLSMQLIGKEEGVNFIQLKDGTKYYCNNILAADGARHGCADMIKANLGINIAYKRSLVQEQHQYHAVVQLKLRKGEKPGPVQKEEIVKKMTSLRQQGWDHSYQPKSFIFPNAEKTKFYFVGEIPKKIFEEDDEAKRAAELKKWAAKAIFQKYGVQETQLEFRVSSNIPAKDRMQATVFEVDINVCEHPLVKLEKGVFAQIGDARRTPNYNILHGMNDAIQGGVTFANAMVPGSFNSSAFIGTIEKMDALIENAMKEDQQIQASARNEGKIKLIDSMDKLIARMERNPSRKEMAKELANAKKMLLQNDKLTTLYDVMEKIQPIVEIHQDTGLLYQCYRAFMSLFSSEAHMTRSAVILEDIKDNLEAYSQRIV